MALEIYAFRSVPPADGGLFNLYECELKDGYRVIVWANGSKADGSEVGKPISDFESGTFNLHVVEKDVENCDYRFSITKEYLSRRVNNQKNLDLSTYDLIDLLDILGAVRTNEVHTRTQCELKYSAVSNNSICPECGGKKILDFILDPV